MRNEEFDQLEQKVYEEREREKKSNLIAIFWNRIIKFIIKLFQRNIFTRNVLFILIISQISTLSLSLSLSLFCVLSKGFALLVRFVSQH